MKSPNFLGEACSAGYFCFLGSDSSTTTQCPAGYYCAANSMINSLVTKYRITEFITLINTICKNVEKCVNDVKGKLDEIT